MSFLKKAKIIHGDRYDYSKVEYINNKTKILIICKVHGNFYITPDRHTNQKSGCQKCSKIERAKTRINKKDFAEEAKKIHKHRYDYSVSEYAGVKHKINIICRVHGIFSLTAGNHLAGTGCAKCGTESMVKKQSLKFKDFVKKAKIIHNNKYKYIKSSYIRARKNINIICSSHGEFIQKAYSHLKGHGCPACGHYISKPEIDWLNKLKIKKEYRNVWIKACGRNFKVDAYDPNTNIVYEFYGDYWHGNPNKYNPLDINQKTGSSFKKLYEKTINREKLIKKSGFSMITIWENDFKLFPSAAGR